MRRIADGAQDARADVVQQHPGDAPEIDPQIFRRRAHHVIRGIHQPQHQRRHRDADPRQDDAHDQRQYDRGLDRAAQPLAVLGAVVLADHDAGAAGEPGEHADERVDDRPRAADGGERLLADEVADDDRVDRVVELLEDVADHQRQRKGDKKPRDAPHGHVGIFFSDQ